jgi:hypothetical protein
MKARYGTLVVKDGIVDDKNCKEYASQEELRAGYEKMKNKYNAQERPQGVGYRIGEHYGLFVSADGRCKHGKKIEVQYAEFTDNLAPSLLPVPK